MARIVRAWNDADWDRELKDRFDRARQKRQGVESEMGDNFNRYTNQPSSESENINIANDDSFVAAPPIETPPSDSEIGINYVFKYVRFWHSQMSANPPSATARPRSSDPKDHRKADTADRIARFLRTEQELDEVSDQCNLNMLIYGTGYTKVSWDPDAGDVADFNEETGELNLDGDHRIYAPDPVHVWLDPDAKRKRDIRYTFEEMHVPLEEAIFRYPDHEKKLRAAVEDANQNNSIWAIRPDEPLENHSIVRMYEYTERGMPVNGFKGRHAVFLDDGCILERGINKHYQHRLTIKVLTYIDVPNQVYGKSVMSYALRLQDMLDRMDSATLDAIQAHNLIRLIVPESADIEDEAISDSSWDWIKASGDANSIKILPPGQLMQDAWSLRAILSEGIQELFGVNDSMQGIQRREQSAVSQQTSIESGTLVHRRIMVKYRNLVEEVYSDMLGIVRDKWEAPRTIAVVGDEKAMSVADFKGADIAGGFDVVVSYGESLPLDPNLAREQLMLMMPMLKEAGMTSREILKMFKLSELEPGLDRMDLAADRQREIFEEMIAKADPASTEEAEYIAPRESGIQEHQGMLDYAYDYVMTSDFKYLPEETKQLIERHIVEREQMMAQQAAPAPAAPNLDPLPGSPGVSGAITPEVGGELPPPSPTPALV